MNFRIVFFSLVLGLFTLATSLNAAITIDGALDGDYGAALVTQNNQTGFGDSSSGLTGGNGSDGSELDVGHAVVQGGILYLFLGGNVQGNFNKLNIFFDSVAGGQNRLLGGNSVGDSNTSINRMGDSGSGNGLKFDAAFAADYLIVLNGDSTTLYADLLDIPTAAGGSSTFLGSTSYGSGGTLAGGTNPFGILLTINNANTAGVSGGIGAGSGAGVTTGAELAIPLTALGNPVGPILISAFINGSGQDFLANQVLGGLGGVDNLGEPRSVDFSQNAGDQFFSVVPEPSTLAFLGLGVIGVGIRALRRKNA